MYLATLLDLIHSRTVLSSDYRLAQALGVTRGAISNFRSGKRIPAPETLMVLCDLAGVDYREATARILEEKATTDEDRARWRKVAEGASAALLVILSVICVTPETQAVMSGSSLTGYTLCFVGILAYAWVCGSHRRKRETFRPGLG